MNRFFILISVLAVVALTGCGGGGGSSSTKETTVTGVITGRVVSTQSGSPGVANVVVRLGSGTATATSDSNGDFQLELASGTTLVPAYLQIDATGAGQGFSKTYPVTYNGQLFFADNINVPVAVRNQDTGSLGTFTLTYVDPNDPDATPPAPYSNKDTVLTGRIIRSDNSAGIANVKISFGTPACTTTTGTNGYFELDLGLEAPVLPLLPGSKTFSIDTSTAGSDYPSSLLVSYNGSSTITQSTVPIPLGIYNGSGETDFGDITIVIGSSGGDVPPPPI